MKTVSKPDSPVSTVIDIFIRIGFLILLLAWCFQLIYPFSGVILWGIIIALALAPIYNSINTRIGDKPKITSTIIVMLGLLVILIPTWLFLESTVDGVKEFYSQLDQGSLTISPPTEKVAKWPIIGPKTHELWLLASTNLDDLLSKYQDQIMVVSKSLLEGFIGIGTSLIQFILSIIIASVLLATKGTDELASKFFHRIIGKRGDEFKEMIGRTVANVTKGVLGVSIIQAILIGIGFLLAGVPYAGVWTLLVLILAILQLPATIVVIPIVIYLFSTTGTTPAILWTVYLFLAGLSDNILKPILLGKGAPVPMLVIFIGVIGGFMFSGFIGLFTGAIMLSIGYKLLMVWLYEGEKVPSV